MLLIWEFLGFCSLLWLYLYPCRVWWGNLELPQFWIWVEWHKRLVLTSSWPAFHLLDVLLSWEFLDSCSLLWLYLYSCRVWWGSLELPQFWIWVEWHKRLVLTSSWPAFHLLDALLYWELLGSCSLLWLYLYSCRVWWGNLELPQFWIWVEWHKRLVLTSSWPAFSPSWCVAYLRVPRSLLFVVIVLVFMQGVMRKPWITTVLNLSWMT